MIRCTQQFNIKCLKCDCLNHEIVRVGAFYMCTRCFVTEFGIRTTEIDPDSELGEVYYKWLTIAIERNS